MMPPVVVEPKWDWRVYLGDIFRSPQVRGVGLGAIAVTAITRSFSLLQVFLAVGAIIVAQDIVSSWRFRAVMDADGVTLRTWRGQRHVPWREIATYRLEVIDGETEVAFFAPEGHQVIRVEFPAFTAESDEKTFISSLEGFLPAGVITGKAVPRQMPDIVPAPGEIRRGPLNVVLESLFIVCYLALGVTFAFPEVVRLVGLPHIVKSGTDPVGMVGGTFVLLFASVLILSLFRSRLIVSETGVIRVTAFRAYWLTWDEVSSYRLQRRMFGRWRTPNLYANGCRDVGLDVPWPMLGHEAVKRYAEVLAYAESRMVGKLRPDRRFLQCDPELSEAEDIG